MFKFYIFNTNLKKSFLFLKNSVYNTDHKDLREI